jgi:nucleotide-binding universal stress UspA family protein
VDDADSTQGTSRTDKEVNRFKHILLPTDGSPLSEAAMRKGIQFAKSLNAKVTGFCVVPVLPYVGCEAEIGAEFKKQAEEAVQAEVNKNLLAIAKAANEAGVECETAKVKSVQPYEAIIETAAKKECDLIIMASHGRRGVGALLIGSETQKVLTHSKIPVLVYR